MIMTTGLVKQDFDLTINYNLFDILYSIPLDVNQNEITEWCVGGWELNSSSDRRCLETILFKYPIPIHIVKVERSTLYQVEFRNIVKSSKEELIKEKRKIIEQHYKSLLEKL